ncbi:hypothetical protein [Hyphomicrobium sulfonivorans]|uniref:hypothetical protein n=1 Tax=Hyphomicrobium sulfonivorans TaxID=121290 RepID=UPI00156DEA2F|nr:hypothetical protein [Hyphomicrobium sulfonivorans]MBI1648339.1 hypothetical protein [Hyphomicrobium sulfonivorans]NSL71126.1 hypothetical protein [Hyphomicrobium sulfonivorans]
MKHIVALTAAPSDRFLIEQVISGAYGDSVTVNIRAATPEGFDIFLYSDAIGVRASFAGLEFDFADWNEAAPWVRRALSREYELRITFQGTADRPGRPIAWRLGPSDGREGGCLHGAHSARKMPWHHRREIIKRNDLL